MKIPIIKIKHQDGYCLINEKDFDPSKHQLFTQEQDSKTSNKTNSSGTTEDREESPKLLNLNTATEKALIELPGVGVSRASLIVENRTYKSVVDAKKKLPDLNWAVIESLVEV